MVHVSSPSKKLSVNPLKSSAPLGAAMAYLGVAESIPLFHGSQGCTASALVAMVRHFKESIPIQTTAMNEISTILGGADHLEEALLNLKARVKPRLIGVCSTALVETRGEDFKGDLAIIMLRRANELAGTKVVFASTPDFSGALEEGWSKAVTAMIEELVERPAGRTARLKQVNILSSVHMSPADLDHVRDLAHMFGLNPIILPDISGSLSGTVPDSWVPTSYGGTSLEAIADMGHSQATLAIGEHMRAPAERLRQLTGVPVQVFDRLTGLEAADKFVVALAQLANSAVPERLRRRRSELVDVMLDSHFHLGGRRIAIAAEPDLLYALSSTYAEVGAKIVCAVTTVSTSKILDRIPVPVHDGDLGDFERLASETGAELLVTHSHGRQASERLGVPLLRVGFPVFDRLGTQHRLSVGYEGTRNILIEAANIFLALHTDPAPEDFQPIVTTTESIHERAALTAH
ncbi:MAG: nitrogenase iron-molybdenum cofactor biosynthesis protein NifN [Hyphomicrobium sp.]